MWREGIYKAHFGLVGGTLIYKGREGRRKVRGLQGQEEKEMMEWLFVVTPCELIVNVDPSKVEEIPVVYYRPDRVARQFGLPGTFPLPFTLQTEAARKCVLWCSCLAPLLLTAPW